MVCDWATQGGRWVSEACPVLAADADLGAFRLASAAGDPQRARFKAQASGGRNMAVPSRFKAR